MGLGREIALPRKIGPGQDRTVESRGDGLRVETENEPRRALLAEIGRTLARTSTVYPMLLSLRAEVLLRSGRAAEARAVAIEAHEEAAARVETDVLVRAHMPVVRERYERIARAAPAR